MINEKIDELRNNFSNSGGEHYSSYDENKRLLVESEKEKIN